MSRVYVSREHFQVFIFPTKYVSKKTRQYLKPLQKQSQINIFRGRNAIELPKIDFNFLYILNKTYFDSLQRVYKRCLWYLIVFKFKLMVIAISMLKELEGIFSQLIHLQLMKRDFGYQLLSWPQKDNLGNQGSLD